MPEMAATLGLVLLLVVNASRALAAGVPIEVADGLARAVAQDEPRARLAQAKLIITGQLAGDVSTARGVLEAAAHDGDGHAAYMLGVLAYQATPTDLANALHWWRLAAQAGETDAQYSLGLLLAADQQHHIEADAAFAAAATKQHVLACFALGTRLASHDARAAQAWLQCAAVQGYGPAQYNLATLLARSAHNDEELALARRWYAAAAPTFAPAANALTALGKTAAQQTTTVALRDDEWVMAQAADAFTVQIASGASAEVLSALLRKQLQGLDVACVRERPSSRQPYSAIVGVYADRRSAERARDDLPSSLRANQPWIRHFGELQQALRKAANSAPPAATNTHAVSN